MGIFDFLKGSLNKTNIESVTDRIWLTRQAKLDGIESDIAKSLWDSDRPSAIILVAHFAEYIEPLEKLVQARRLDSNLVTVVMTDDLPKLVPQLLALPETSRVDLIAGERHPLASHDDQLRVFAERLECRCRIIFYDSLDDPLMEIFCSDWAKSILERLGMQEGEAIESHMITRRIGQAQKKIASLVVSDTPANSSHEWLQLNRAIQ